MATMYSEWVSLQHDLRADKGNRSVLNTFPRPIGRDIAHTVAKTFIQDQNNEERKKLSTAAEIDWVLEVFCYGLSLPMTEADGEVIKGCVNIYIDWLSVLLMDEHKQGIPQPLIQEPVKYIRKIFQHLKNLFLIRVDDGSNLALQASLCIRVLQFFKVIASESVLTAEIWDAILRLMLVINEQLLSPPYTPGGLCDHLKEILIHTLLEVWLYASLQYFPPPSMWKTLQEMCMSWRHHNAMIEYWSSTSLLLTRKVIKHLYGNSFSLPSLKGKKNDVILPPTMTDSTLLQCWFRILHIIGNPVDLCNKELISDTPKFKEFALSCQDVMLPSAHPCLDCLPEIFLHAMKGIAVMVNTFLNITSTHEQPVMHTAISAPRKGSSPSGSKKREVKTLSTGLALGLGEQRGLGMRSLTMPSRHSSGTAMTSIASQDELDSDKVPATTPASALFSKFPSAVTSPSVDSLLDLYGAWLFEAAFAKLDMPSSYDAIGEVYDKCFDTMDAEEPLPPSSPRKVSVESSSSLLKRDFTDDFSFEPGRAEAYGVLCRIFCSPRSEQAIRPVYLSRFYLAIAIGLVHDETCTGHVLCSILLNSPDLLRVDLQGVQVLLPHLIAALEIVLSKREVNLLRCPVSITELRRAAIHLLVSMLCLPLHFQSLPIQDMTAGYMKEKQQQSDNQPTETTPLTFLSLKPRITRLLLDALQVETDSHNVQILLGGVSVIVQDTEMAHSIGIIEPPVHFPPVQADKEPANWIEFATRNRTRASTGGSSMVSDLGSFMDESEAKLTFSKTTNESYDPTTVCGLFVQMTHLLCNKLVVTRSSKWKPDLHVTLAAFEVLTGLAQLSMDYLDPTECKSTIHWLCDYVSLQANKPATHHSRDLHSMIVAAFHCIKTWVMAHPELLDSEDCLQAVMEVVELGISGSKSKDARTEPEQGNTEPSLKGVKQLKPVSFRVRQAAEGLLTCIMEHLGAFPSPCGPSAQSSLLNEESLLEYSKTNKGLTKYDGQFRYFAIRDNSYILGVLEDSLETRDTLPTITSIIRAPSGRHVWTMELRQFSRKKHDLIEAHLTDPGRPMPRVDQPKPSKQVVHRYFPATVDTVPLTNADRSIPELDDILDNKLSEVQDHMRTLMQKQAEHEAVEQTRVDREKKQLRFPSADTESVPLEPCETFRASRLFLSHHGLLSIEGLKGNPDNSSEDPSLIALDSSRQGFRAALENLDNVPTRNQDTVFVFYVKSGQHDADEIIENKINSCKYRQLFIEFLLSLGWPVDVDAHPGWTGNVDKSWIPSEDDTETKSRGSKGIDRSSMLAGSMSTITSSTSTMYREGDITPSSDEENWFVRDRFLTQHKESEEGELTQSDTVTLEDSPTKSESASDADSVTQVDSGIKEQSDSSVTQEKSSTSVKDSVAHTEPPTSGASVAQKDSVTPSDSVTPKDNVTPEETVTQNDSKTQKPPSGNNDYTKSSKLTSSAKSFEKDLNQILYYADISGEVAFVVPALLPQYQRFRKMIVKGETTSDDETEEADEPHKDPRRTRAGSMGSLEIKSSSTSSMNELRLPLTRQASDGFAAFGSRSRFPEPADSGKPIAKPNAHTTSSETSVVVAWLEHFPDHSCFPIDDILVEMDFGNSSNQRGLVDKDIVVLFIHILQNGLYRVHIRSTIKSPIAGPLVDGMVVSRRALGTMVRHTALNIANRRRLEIDSYTPPSVCRKLKIQDIVKKYRQEIPVPEFYLSFFGEEN